MNFTTFVRISLFSIHGHSYSISVCLFLCVVALQESKIFKLLVSDEGFPIDFDDAWRWVGYKKKESPLRKLKAKFEEGFDYIVVNLIASPNREAIKGGQNRIVIKLTIDCFKIFCMMADTSKGKEVRKYFIQCEQRLKALLNEPSSEVIKKRLIEAIVSNEVVSRGSKFGEWFYDMIYRKRGGDWAKRSRKNRPSCVGTWTNQIVYDQMIGKDTGESVKSKLLEVEPKIDGRRKNPLHSHFSKDFGEKYLAEHFKSLQLIDRLTPDGDWEKFLYFIDKAFPQEDKQIKMNLFYELGIIDSLQF